VGEVKNTTTGRFAEERASGGADRGAAVGQEREGPLQQRGKRNAAAERAATVVSWIVFATEQRE